MRKTLIFFVATCLIAGAASAQTPTDAPPAHRPSEKFAGYIWDVICMAADNHWKINSGVAQTSADEADSMRLMNAAIKSAEANGKDVDAMADDMMPHFSAYLYDDHPYFGMTSGEMRAYCLKVLDE